MRLRNFPGILLALLIWEGLGTGCGDRSSSSADVVLRNGFIYTVDHRRTTAEAVAIKDGAIIYVGNTDGASRFTGESTRVIDLKGRMVLPGFIDSHCHAISAYRQFFELSLNGLRTVAGYQKAIRDFAARHPGAKYLKGRGWSNTVFHNTGPDRKILDEIVSDIPVMISSEDGHSKWVNTKTLELAGVTRTTPNPDGGIIERDPATGEPNGTLRENAADLASKLFPPNSVEELMKGLEAYQKMALGFGITTVHEASIDVEGNEIPAFENLERENGLAMRFRVSLSVDPGHGLAQVTALANERAKHTGPLFRTNSAKIFVDGVVEGSTAYLKKPYNHLPRSRGELLCSQEDLNRICAELDNNGFQIHVHAIGDAAIAATLDAFAYAEGVNGRRDARHLITHLQLVDAQDIPRFKQLGVVAVPQPYWFVKDDYYYNLQVPYLGKKRADEEYPMRSFFDNGVVVASASDYPVTVPCNPLVAIQIGITRSRVETTDPKEVLWPEERVTLDQMIASFTINGAYANFLEKSIGSVEVGKLADLIVLDRNLFTISVAEISNARVVMTLVEGRERFRDSLFVP